MGWVMGWSGEGGVGKVGGGKNSTYGAAMSTDNGPCHISRPQRCPVSTESNLTFPLPN